MNTRTLLSTMMVGLVLCALPIPGNAQTSPLAGSWQFTLTPTTPPAIPTVTIPGLATFNSDGNMTETNGSEVVVKPPSTTGSTFSSPGHGIWQLGPTATYYYVQFISLVVSPNGALVGTNNTAMNLTLASTGTTFTGTYTTQLINSSGMILKTTNGKASGTLIPHPLLP